MAISDERLGEIEKNQQRSISEWGDVGYNPDKAVSDLVAEVRRLRDLCDYIKTRVDNCTKDGRLLPERAVLFNLKKIVNVLED